MLTEDFNEYRVPEAGKHGTEGVLTAVGEWTEKESPDSTTEETSTYSSEKSSSVQKYEDEWSQLYCSDDPEFGELRRRAVLGNLRSSRFRSVCWRCLLDIFPSTDHLAWLHELRANRQHYAQLLRVLCKEPWDRRYSNDHPLSEKSESLWNQYFCDQGLQAVIRQDVDRTFPGVEFFRKESIQNSMVNILFCYARENPAMCYRQGMHEILAPLLFVLHCDHQALLHTKEQVEVNLIISEVLDPAYLEEDGYTLFCKIMRGIEPCYRINDLTPDATGYFPPSTLVSNADSSTGQVENEVIAQLTWIKENLLVPHDPDLHNHLQQLDIPLPLFGIRWLRLLFGREFPLEDLLVLWDAIFAEGHNFELVNYIVVAMLIAIRQQLLRGDYTTCLTYLMRYPAPIDITYIIDLALYLKEPMDHCPPACVNNLVGSGPGLSGSSQQLLPVANKKTFGHSQSQGGPLTRLKKLSSKPSRWTVGKPKTKDIDNIVDGFTLDDPVVIRAEIQHAHEIMTLCRIKLIEYHRILKRCVYPCENPGEAHQVLDGVLELCTLLGSRYHLQPSPMVEVEAASEADEIRQHTVPTSSRLPLRNEILPKGEVALKLFSKSEGMAGQIVVGAPLANPLIGFSQYCDE